MQGLAGISSAVIDEADAVPFIDQSPVRKEERVVVVEQSQAQKATAVVRGQERGRMNDICTFFYRRVILEGA